MDVTFRALPHWPHPETPSHQRRSRWTFKASYMDTLWKLEYEVGMLGGRDVVLGAGFRERDIRLDGMPRSDARQPDHPGVEISFDSDHGRLTYATDTCDLWQHNVRSIALGLEALRAVDRYGITQSGQQYAGFVALAADNRLSRGRRLVEEHGSIKEALMATHPDRGGDPKDFIAVRYYEEQS